MAGIVWWGSMSGLVIDSLSLIYYILIETERLKIPLITYGLALTQLWGAMTYV